MAFDKATRMPRWSSNAFRLFVLMVISVKNSDSQKYIVRNGIKNLHSSLYKERISFSQGAPTFSKVSLIKLQL
jgi:hypothetical protein